MFRHFRQMIYKLRSIISVISKKVLEGWHEWKLLCDEQCPLCGYYCTCGYKEVAQPAKCSTCEAWLNNHLWERTHEENGMVHNESCVDCGAPPWAWGKSIIEYDLYRSGQMMANLWAKRELEAMKTSNKLMKHFDHLDRLNKLYDMIGWRPPKTATEIGITIRNPPDIKTCKSYTESLTFTDWLDQSAIEELPDQECPVCHRPEWVLIMDDDGEYVCGDCFDLYKDIV